MQRGPSCEESKTAGEPYPRADDILRELDRITESTDFKSTPRRKKLLRYLVEELLAGRTRELKGYSIATLVFERDDTFDPQTDPVVRLEARRLRHDLDGYYASVGRDRPLRIMIPKGQYVPLIEWLDPAKEITSEPASVPSVEQAVSRPRNSTAPDRRQLLLVAACAFLVLFLVGISFIERGLAVPNSRVDENGPSLVVLPFLTKGDNPKDSLLALGLADEIMASISRFAGIRLYLPSGRERELSGGDPIEIGRNLSLSYVVDGSVDLDQQNQTLRTSARLIDVGTQRILWIGTYDRRYSARSLRPVQQEIANSIAATLGQPYGILNDSMITDPETTAISSYECVLQAYAYRRSFTKALHTPVLSCLQDAVARDPNYVDAWAMLAWLYMDEGRFDWLKEGSQVEAYRRAVSTAQHALALDRNNILALKALSSTLHYMGEFPEAERIQRQAYLLNPNDPDLLAQLGWRLAVRGNFVEGIPYLKQALDRSVNPPGWYYHLIAIDQYLNGQYDAMLTTSQRSTIDGSAISWSLVAIANGALGRKEEARKALALMNEKSPLLARDPASMYRRHHAVDRIVDALVSGLRKAGSSGDSTQSDPA
jgi:TolB-like protein